MVVNKKLVLLGAELLAILVLRGIYLWRKHQTRPTGSRVEKVAGRPVYKMPFVEVAAQKKEPKPFIWKPNPRFNRKTDPQSDSPETRST